MNTITEQELERRLLDLDARLRAEVADDEDFEDAIVSIANMSLARYRAFLKRRDATPFGRPVAELRDLLLSTAIPFHASAPPKARAKLVSLIGRRPRLLGAVWRLLEEHRWKLQKAMSANKPAALQLVLHLALLAEHYLDRREVAFLLSAAWGDAEDAGLDPAVYFREAAALAGTRRLSHAESAREILEHFEPLDFGA